MIKYSLILIVTIGTILMGCKTSTKKSVVSQHIGSLINYFDSSRIKEFDTVSFDKNTNGGINFWKVISKGGVCYTYKIGFPNLLRDTNLLEADNLERISILDSKLFARHFPMTVNLPDENIDMILNKNGLIDIRASWDNSDYNEKNDILFLSVEPMSLFKSKNPFEYFKSRTKTMDSLGVEGILRYPFGNLTTITIKDEQEFIDYLPDNLFIKDSYRHKFDSVIAKGIKINKNWVWRKYPTPL